MKKSHVKLHKKEQPSICSIPKKYAVVGSFVLIAVLVLATIALSQDKVAATVGDRKIYQKSLDSLYAALPPGSALTKEQILQRMVDTKVLVDYIENSDFSLPDEQFNLILQKELADRGMTQDEFEKQLAVTGATMTDYRESKEIELFVKEEIDTKIKVTPEQIALFKKTNPTAQLSDADITKVIFQNTRQQLVQQIIKLHKSSVVITYG